VNISEKINQRIRSEILETLKDSSTKIRFYELAGMVSDKTSELLDYSEEVITRMINEGYLVRDHENRIHARESGQKTKCKCCGQEIPPTKTI
jgi:RNA polymerase-binding transcription factor DksA